MATVTPERQALLQRRLTEIDEQLFQFRTYGQVTAFSHSNDANSRSESRAPVTEAGLLREKRRIEEELGTYTGQARHPIAVCL